MKFQKTCLVLSVLNSIFVAQTSFAKIPTSWIHPQPIGFLQSDTNNDESKAADKDFDKILNSSYAIISPSLEQKDKFGLTTLNQNAKQGPWYLASIKTEIGIEASGEIGYVGVGGEAAVEYIWQRTARSIKKLQAEQPKQLLDKNHKTTDIAEPDVLTLETDMSNEQIAEKINNLVAYVDKGHKVSNTKKFRAQLLNQVATHQALAQQVALAANELTWSPYKYQLELFVKASGDVIPTVEVGGVLRLRIEWNIKEIKTPRSKMNFAPSFAFANNVEMITNEFSSNIDKFNTDANAFYLYGLKIGLGIGAGGDIEIAELKGHAIASVFLKYNPNTKTQKRIQNSITNMFIAAPVAGLSKEQWQRGIRKTIDMTSQITLASSKTELLLDQNRPKREFELGAIEIELSIEASGEFLLPTVEGIAFMEIFFAKKKPLKP